MSAGTPTILFIRRKKRRCVPEWGDEKEILFLFSLWKLLDWIISPMKERNTERKKERKKERQKKRREREWRRYSKRANNRKREGRLFSTAEQTAHIPTRWVQLQQSSWIHYVEEEKKDYLNSSVSNYYIERRKRTVSKKLMQSLLLLLLLQFWSNKETW